MQATLALREKAAQLLAADATTLAQPTDLNKMILIMAEFNALESTVIGDLTPADFDGSAALLQVTGTQPEGLDPNNTDAIITLKPPAGGWRWETTGITNLPQTIYGFALINDAETTLFCSEKLPTPITLTGVNQVIDIGSASIRQLANSMT